MVKNKNIRKTNNHVAIWLFVWINTVTSVLAKSANYVAAGVKAVNFGTVNLAAPSGVTWSTNRSAIPGYFSAYGSVTYREASDADNGSIYVRHNVQTANQGFTFSVGSGTDLRTLTSSGILIGSSTALNIGLVAPTVTGTINCSQTVMPLTHAQGTASQTEEKKTINVASVGSYLVAATNSGMTLANGVTTVIDGQTGVQTFYIPVNYDGASTLDNTMLTAGSASSCVSTNAPAAGTVDCSQTASSPAPIQGAPEQTVLITTINVTLARSFPVTASGSGMTLINGQTSVSTTTGRQKFYLQPDYDGSALGPLNFTVGDTDSCSANLISPPKQPVANVQTLARVRILGPVLK